MTFAEGFAQSFNQQWNRKREQEDQLENTKFKYGLEQLSTKRDLRMKKQAEESEWATQAKQLANGDNDLAATIFKDLAAKVGYDTVQKRIAEGGYVKNDKYVAPDRTVKIPAGVAPAPVRYDEELGIDPKTAKRIGEIDNTLLEGTDDKAEFSATDESSPYIYKPAKETKVGDYADSLYKVAKAKESGDPVAIRDAELQLKANQEAAMAKAEADAKAKGEAVNYFAIKDADGNITSNRFQGEVRDVDGVKTLWNVSNPLKPVPVEAPAEAIVRITPKQNEYWRDVSTRYDKTVSDYNTSVVAYGSFANTSEQLRQIYKDTPEVVSNPTKVVSFVNSLSEDVQHALSIIDKQTESASNLAKNGDKDTIATEGSKFVKTAEDAVQQIEQSTTLSPANKQLALNYAKYKSLMVSATMQAAASYGIGGANMANKEFDRFSDMLQGSTGETLMANLDLIDREIVSNLYATEKTMDSAEVRTFASELGVKGITDLTPRRVGDVLANPILRARYDATRKAILEGSSSAAAGAEGQAGNAPPVAPPIVIKTQEEYKKLKSGDRYTDPQGNVRMKK